VTHATERTDRRDGDSADGHSRMAGVQSIGKVFTLLEIMADHGGMMGLTQLAAEAGHPTPTTHRFVRTLVNLGYLRQQPTREYVLAPRLIRLGESSSSLLGVWARPQLSRLVDELGESANLAMLDGDQIVYVAQAPSRHSMRMFTEVGRRVSPHCTAVGKVLMADLPPERVREILNRTGMPKHTDSTITDPEAFAQHLQWAKENGYAIDEGEQEVGVRCVAVAVPDAPAKLSISISGPAARVTEALVRRAVPILTEAGQQLSADLR
jgi:IclR family transcriptional regulator, acetate operon repressor